MEPSIAYQWFALCIVFLFSSIWSGENVRYGYVLIPLIVGFFWWIGWITFAYMGTIVPLIIMIGILSYLRSHLKYKFGVFGSNGGLLFKIVAFCIFFQFAVVFVNGLVVFNTQYVPDMQNEFSSYSISKAQTVYGSSTANLNIFDMITTGMTILWNSYRMFWSIVFGFFNIYDTLANVLHVPWSLSIIISMGVYLLTAIEVFILIFKPYRPPEV